MKKILSVSLILAFLISFSPISVFADNGKNNIEESKFDDLVPVTIYSDYDNIMVA